MTYKTNELEVVEQFIQNGAHIVPYYRDSKAVPKGFHWGQEQKMRLTEMRDVLKYVNKGLELGLVLSTANAVLVDIDCLLPLTVAEMKALGIRMVNDYASHKKKEWKALSDDYRDDMLVAAAEKAEKECPFHALMPSGSGNGIHMYYRVFEGLNYNGNHQNIEIYANFRMAYITDWTQLADYWHTEPMSIQKILDFWKPEQKQINDLYKIKPTASDYKIAVYKETPNGKRFDYETFIERSSYAQIGHKCACWLWLMKAHQLDDQVGVNEGLAYFATRLDSRKIAVQHQGAIAFARSHPDTTTYRPHLADKYQPNYN